MASPRVDTLFWANSDVFCFETESFWMTSSLFCNQNYISDFFSFRVSFCEFLLHIWTWLFASRKYEKVQKFNRVRALILSPSCDFLTRVCLSYRAYLPLCDISVFLVRSIHGPSAFLTRSCLVLIFGGTGVQGCAFISYPCGGKPGSFNYDSNVPYVSLVCKLQKIKDFLTQNCRKSVNFRLATNEVSSKRTNTIIQSVIPASEHSLKSISRLLHKGCGQFFQRYKYF